ncbi:hypothetical protein E2A64_10180 [Pseudohoeflea suaedae]|uniref:Uncharacterized protein n=1 Tax=Pseudohoeflea suaedae TaxID=877384 RepID=A0A4R5PK78_9HYPH|nr:hypothetical protein [Pseudohoeflea suaedae]TDH35698.1 hypothetical protein E2A64_10180 [Pseudohoeflea suaedae]
METKREDDFTPHDGRPRPVPSFASVDIKFRDGDIFTKQRAGHWIWEHHNDPSDIVAYRMESAE